MAFVMHIVKETTNMDFCYFTGAAKAPGQLCRLQPQHSCPYMYLVMFVDHFSGHVGTFQVDKDKVNRCLARYSPRATTTNQPTNRALNKPTWPGPN